MQIDSHPHLAHRKPIDVLEISYGGPETYREFEKRKTTIAYHQASDC
jgi:hypothetical protein